MQSLDNLIGKILLDGDARAEQILSEATSKADEILAERETQANADAAKILEKAQADAERSYERHVAERKLKLRDKVLSAKGEMLDKVFEAAIARLNNMPKGDFIAYLKDALAEQDTDGEALLLPAKYGIDDIKEINAHLKSKGKKGNLTLSGDSSRAVSGGFILSKDGIEQNNTFEALVGFYRYRLEADIRKELF